MTSSGGSPGCNSAASDDPVVAGLGTVLYRQTLGKQLDLLIQDPTSDAAERLRAQAGVADVEEAVPGLEDIYAAVMRNAGRSVPGVPIMIRAIVWKEWREQRTRRSGGPDRSAPWPCASPPSSPTRRPGARCGSRPGPAS